MNIPNVTDETYKDLFESGKKYVVIDCWATWCGPCKMFAKTFEEVSDLPYFTDFIFAKADVEECYNFSSTYGIRNVPTVLVLNTDGKVVNKFSGAKSKEAFVEFLIQFK